MAYGLSNGHVTIKGEERQLSGHLQSPTVIDDGRLVSEWVTLKGQTRDPNTLRAQYLENYLS